MNVYDRKGLVVRLVYLAIALVWWLITARGRLSKTRVITLCYHGVTAQQKNRFAKQMAHISKRAISCDRIHLQDKAIAARPAVCITFDDAFANLLDNALPIICKLDIPVIVFAVTENMGSTPRWKIDYDHPDAGELTMTLEQLKRASKETWCSIASHSATHPRLSELPDEAVERELIQSKIALENLLGESVYDFAFPYGVCSEKLISKAFECGYRRVYTLSPDAGKRSKDQQIISRMTMTPDVWPIEFRLTVTGAYAWIYWLRKICMWIQERPSETSKTSAFELQAPRT
ncbi:MAG: polysaccharide deacetylase family protein [Planctomycetes bacterium]|nr:polysaccharide deacetylase family protein [Planctomycetota bacterium]